MRLAERFDVLSQLVGRAIEERYRDSVLGVFWAIATPFMMLTVFAFVFGVIFQARWGGAADSTVEFAIILFTGLIVFNLFSETVSASPGIVVSQANFVKKSRFPLELLHIAQLFTSLFHALIAIASLLIVKILFGDGIPPTIVLLPLALLPITLTALGLSWFLSAVSVYIRDVAQIIPPVLTALLFLTPIFYPPEALPEAVRPWLAYSPLALAVEHVRMVVLFGEVPRLSTWGMSLLAGMIIATIGRQFFQAARKGFADVL